MPTRHKLLSLFTCFAVSLLLLSIPAVAQAQTRVRAPAGPRYKTLTIQNAATPLLQSHRQTPQVVPLDSGTKCSIEVCMHIFGPNGRRYVNNIEVWNRFGSFPNGDYPAEILYKGSTAWPGGVFFALPGSSGINVIYNADLPAGQYCGALAGLAGKPCAYVSGGP